MKQAPFWERVDVRGPDECWPWTGCLDRDGYGKASVGGVVQATHRVAWESKRGPVPAGMVLDHTCHNDSGCAGGKSCPHRSCCNPDHMEPASTRENTMRGNTIPARNAAKVECKAGHPFDEGNTYVSPSGHRRCRACNAAAVRRYKKGRVLG